MTLIQTAINLLTTSLSTTMLALIPTLAVAIIAGSLAIRRKTDSKGTEPPMVPYLIPWLGSAIPFMRDYHHFLEHNANKNNWAPFTFLMFGQRCVSINDDLSVDFFKRAKELQWDPVLDKYLGDCFGVPRRVIHLSKEAAMHDIFAQHLTAREGVDEWLGRFVGFLHTGLAETLGGDDDAAWREVDLFRWCSDLFFRAGTLTLYGEDFPVDAVMPLFRTFDQGSFQLLMGWPRVAIPKVYAARDEITRITAEWLKKGGAKRAARIVQVREEMHEREGLGWEERASLHLMLFWSTHINAPNASFWCLLSALQSPSLLTTVKRAIAPTILTNNPPAPPELNIPALVASPPLSSLLHEVLRLNLTGSLLRIAVAPAAIGPYTVRAGDLVHVPIRHIHYCPVKHPRPDTFVWDRFLDKETGECDIKPLGMRPFGGGAILCPGRNFAKMEVLGFLGTVVAGWEWEVLEGQGEVRRKDVPRQGVVGPEGDVKVRVRRRRGGLLLD